MTYLKLKICLQRILSRLKSVKACDYTFDNIKDLEHATEPIVGEFFISATGRYHHRAIQLQ